MKRTQAVTVTMALLALVALTSCTSFKRWAYTRGDRDAWQHPEKVITVLEIEPGQRVADLGSGGGYFSFRLADAVGPGGVVYAVDVDRAMNEDLARRARKRGYENIEIVMAAYDDPRIPGEGVDLIFTSNTYHHIEHRSAYFGNARRYLKPGGRVAIIDYKREGWLRKLIGHSMERDVITGEMESTGYRLESDHDFLPNQHFLVFAYEGKPGRRGPKP